MGKEMAMVMVTTVTEMEITEMATMETATVKINAMKCRRALFRRVLLRSADRLRSHIQICTQADRVKAGRSNLRRSIGNITLPMM
ncbi:hypothetical protein D3C85_1351480 [compost metagenome]